jgi:hypothetical protein
MVRNPRFLLVGGAIVFVIVGTVTFREAFPSAQAQAVAMSGSFDGTINQNAQRMLEEGRRIFRFDTFGSEDFWGDKLGLHQAIVGHKLGGVGPGVSPTMAPRGPRQPLRQSLETQAHSRTKA